MTLIKQMARGLGRARGPRPYVGHIICIMFLAGCNFPQPTVSPIITPAPSVLATPAAVAYPTRVPIVPVPGNLLIDPSLEGPYHSDGIHPEVNTSYAWKAWFSCQGDQSVCIPPCKPMTPGCYLPCPTNCLQPNGKCATDYGCYWARQEFNPFDWSKAFYRVHSGNMAQVIFSYGRMALGGIRQTVTVTLGTWLKFSAFVQAWQCYSYLACDGGRRSDQPSDMHLRIGIDPTGGIDVNSADIVWSAEQEAFDRWVPFTVIAQAQADQVTVFTQGGATFDYARMNNDVYLDDLALVVTTPMTNRVYLPEVIR